MKDTSSPAVQIKICGMTRLGDAHAAALLGAHFVGFVLAPESPRALTLEQVMALAYTLPPGIRKVGVFVNRPADEIVRTMTLCALDIAQLHGDEPAAVAEAIGPDRVWKAVHLRTDADVKAAATYPAAALVADSRTAARRGGTGQTGNWDLAAALASQRPVVLAGGLTPDNVAQAVRTVRPYAVDVSSGVEQAPGIKDLALMESFIVAAGGGGRASGPLHAPRQAAPRRPQRATTRRPGSEPTETDPA